MDIELKMPSLDSPGFLRRSKQALEVQKYLDKDNITTEAIDKLIEFILPYIVIPEGKTKEDIENVLLDLSQNSFIKLFEEFTNALSPGISPQA